MNTVNITSYTKWARFGEIFLLVIYKYLSSFINICEFKSYLKAIRCSKIGMCYVAYMYLEYHLKYLMLPSLREKNDFIVFLSKMKV